MRQRFLGTRGVGGGGEGADGVTRRGCCGEDVSRDGRADSSAARAPSGPFLWEG